MSNLAQAIEYPNAAEQGKAQPLPDISKWSNGFSGWNILHPLKEGQGDAPQLGLLIAESGVAEKRIFGWAALFVLLAALFGFFITLDFANPLTLMTIAFVFLGAALYRFATWYSKRDLKVEIHREGFMLHQANQTHTVLWRDVDHVVEQWQKIVIQGIIHINKHKVEIHLNNGEKLELNRSLEKIEQIGRFMQLAVADFLLPAYMERLGNHAECDFGAFRISRMGIKRKDHQFLSWEKVKSLEVFTRGQTTVRVQPMEAGKWSSGWATENGGAIKNLQLFLSLSYWFIEVARRPDITQADISAASQEADHGETYYRLPVTKKEARQGTQRTLYIGTPRQERQLVIKVPPGVSSGTLYHFPDFGRSIPGKNLAGTLIVEVLVETITPLQKRMQDIQILTGIVLLAGGLMWLGFWSSLDLLSSLILAVLIGGLGGALMSIQYRLLGLISGAIGGAICYLLQVIYYVFMVVAFGRESFWNYESVLVLFLTALPGIGLYLLLKNMMAKKPEQP